MMYTSLDDRIIAICFEQLRSARTVVAAAGGIEKTQAALGSSAPGSLRTSFSNRN